METKRIFSEVYLSLYLTLGMLLNFGLYIGLLQKFGWSTSCMIILLKLGSASHRLQRLWSHHAGLRQEKEKSSLFPFLFLDSLFPHGI